MLSEIGGKLKIGDRVREKANALLREKGKIANVIGELKKFDEQKQEIFKDVTIQIVTNLIGDKKSYPDFMLSLAWELMKKYDSGNAEDSKLFETVMQSSNNIVQNKDKRDWFWMKSQLLASNVKSEHVRARCEYAHSKQTNKQTT